MSTTIDNKVVSMRFDNKNFEQNVRKSMSTIDKLKEKLKFEKTADSFKSLDKAAKKVRFDTVEHGIEQVKIKLSALDVFAVTAFQRISNAAITTGKNLVKSFTIDPVKTGLQEYETQINAVQTILANTKNKGSTIDDVNRALDELNTYADKTIYNFTEMTRNIGTFTAAGVGLKESTQAIKGIANLAAVSGSNAQQASTAMYQLSQALAAGKVSLQDWNSVVNAGMGGEVFQEALKRTSRVLGTGVDEAIEKYGTFRESLSKGAWLTTDVLTETLAQLSGAYTEADLIAQGYTKKQAKEIADMAQTATDAATKVKTFTQLMDTLKEAVQSGWTQTWELIIGDFEEAKALFTEASDYIGGIIGKSADNRNNLVKGAMQNVVSSDDWAKLKEAGVATKSFKNAIIETAEANGISIKKMIEDNGSFEKTLKTGWLNKDILTETLKKNEKQLSASTLKMSKSMKEYFKIADQVMKGSWGKGKQAQEALTKAGYDYAQVQNLVNGMTEYGAKDFEKLCMAQLKSEGVTKKQAKAIVQLAKEAKKTGTPINELMEKMERKSGRELLIDSIRNSAMAIIKPFKAMKKAWTEIFPPATSEDLYNIINALHEFTVKLNNIDKDGEKLTRTFKGIFAIVKLVSTLVGGGLKVSLSLIQGIMNSFNVDILDVTASIGDALVKFEKWINSNNMFINGMKFVGACIGKVISNVYEFTSAFGSIPVVQNTISKFGNIINKSMNIAGERFKEIDYRIDKFVDRVKSMDDISLDNLDDIFKDFKENVLDYIFDIDGRVSDITDSFAALRTNISNEVSDSVGVIGDLKDVIISFAVDIKEKLSKYDIFGPLLTIGTGMFVIKSMKTISDIFKTFSGVIDNFKAPLKSITGALDQLTPTLKAYAFNLKSEAILNIAKAIAVLAGSLFLLSKIKPERLFSAAGALTVMTAALAGLCLAMSKFKIVDIGKISSTVMAMSSSLLILTIALKQMDKLKSENILRNVAIISGLMVGLTLFATFSSKMPGVSKNMVSIAMFAVALRMLVNTLQKLDGMDIQNLRADLLAMLGMVTVLGKISKVTGNVRFTSGAGLILIVVSLRMFMKTLASMATFDYKLIQSNIGNIAVILGMFGLLIAASNKAGANAAKAGVMMTSVSVAMVILTKAIRKINEISKEELRNASNVIAGMLLVFSAVIAVSKIAGENALKAGGMILMMSGALLAISVVAAILSKLDPSGLARATASISILIGCFSMLVAASGLAKDCKSNLIVMTSAIGLLAVSIGALSLIDPKKLKTTTMAMGTLMTTFALMTASTKFSKNATKQLASITGVVAILGTIITVMSSFNLQNAISASASLSILLTSLSASLMIASKADNVSKKSIVAMYSISGVVAILGGILGAMDALNVSPSIETASAISILLISMTAVCGALSKIGPISAGATSGALALSKVIIVIGGVMVGLGALVDLFPSMETFLNKGIGLLNGIASGLGEFVGNIIGGIGEGVTDHIPAIGKNLAEFAENISGVDPSVAESAKVLAETLLILGGAEIVNAIASWLTGDASISDFAAQLEKFGQSIADFSNAVSGGKVDSAAVQNAAEAGKKIVELAQMIPNSGGWLGAIVGNNDIEDFAPQMVKLGDGIVDFSKTIKDGNVDSNAIVQATEAGRKIVELATLIPNSGGWLGAIVGNNDIEDFAPQLEKFGKGIVDFSTAVDDKVKIQGITDAHEAGKKIIELASLIPNSGGWLGNIVGNNDINEFAPQLEKFADGIVSFSEAVGNGIKTGPIDSVKEAGTKAIELAKIIYSANRELTYISKITYFDKMCENVKKIGNSLASITSSDIAKVSEATITKVTNNVRAIINITSLISRVNSSDISALPKTFTDLSKVSIDGFINNFNNSKSNVQNAVSSMLNAAESAIKNKHSSFIVMGSQCVSGFLTGMSNKVKSGAVYSAGKSIGDEALRGARESLDIHSPSRKMKEVAKYTVDGFTNYMNGQGKNEAKKATGNVASTVEKEASKNASQAEKKNTKRLKSAGVKATNTVKKVSKEFLSSMGKELKKVENKYKSIDVTKKTKSTMKKFVKNGTKATKVIKYAGDTVKKFGSMYLKTIKNTKTQTTKASSAVAKFAKRLYEQSDAYKEDQRNLKNLIKTQKDYYKQKVDITKKLSKVKTEDEKKRLQKELKDVEKNLKKSSKAINKYGETIEKNIKKTFNELKKSIKNTVKDYINIFNVAKETINLFDSSVFDDMATDKFTDIKYSVKDSLDSLISVLDISLDTGVDIFSKFSDGAEDMADAVTQAEKEVEDATMNLNDAQNELAEAQQELAQAQAKSNSVFGRSQRYLDKVKEAEEKVAEAQKKVTDATNSQAEAMSNLESLKTDTSVEEMLSNMESNIKGVEELRKNLDDLAKRGIDGGLLKYLKELGTSGADQVATFVKMTDEELKKAGAYFQQFSKLSSKNIVDGFKEKKNAMVSWGESVTKFSSLKLDAKVKEALLSEFQEQGVDSADYINAILNMTEDELKQFNSDYLEILNTPDAIANEVIAARKKIEEANNEKKKSGEVDEYIATMKANINAQKAYNDDIAKLRDKAKKGLISEDFLKYLENLGEDGKDIISSFVNASNDKLKEANNLYAKSAEMAGDAYVENYGKSIANVNKWDENIEKVSKLKIPAKLKEELIKECEEQGVDAGNEVLETILGLTPKQLSQLVSEWKEGKKSTKNAVDSIVASTAKISNDAYIKTGSAVEASVKKVTDEVDNTVNKTTKKVGNAPVKALTEVNKVVKNKTPEVKSTVAKSAKSVMKTISTNLSSSKCKSVGKKACEGVATGINNNISIAKKAASNLASAIVNTIKNKLSELNGNKFINGLSSFTSSTSKSSKNTSSSVNIMHSSVNKVASASTKSRGSSTTTIRPVLDMSSVNKSISSAVSTLSSGAMGINVMSAASVAKSMIRNGLSQNGSSISKNYDNSQHKIENNFNITGDNPKEIANEVSKIIQNQINRKSTTWA